ncbi:MAG: hypothetical protein AB1489_02490, partial [Acidobacteriota bacterium]
TKDIYYSFTAGPGEIKFTVNVIANGGTVYFELFDNDARAVRFEGNYSSFSLAASTNHNEQASAIARLENRQPLLMRISNAYPEVIEGFRIKLGGAVELAEAKSSDNTAASAQTAMLFSDRDQPKALVSKEINGIGTTKDIYYGFTAGPGELKLTLNVIANGGSVYLELFDTEEKRLRYSDNSTSFSLSASSNNTVEKSLSVRLEDRKRLLLRISNTYPNDIKSYRIKLDGAIELGEDRAGLAGGAIRLAAVSYFASRSRETKD